MRSVGRKGGSLASYLMDGDLTSGMMEAESFPAKTNEEHYGVVSEPVSNYPVHFASEQVTTQESHPEQIAKVLFAWLKERGFDKTF